MNNRKKTILTIIILIILLLILLIYQLSEKFSNGNDIKIVNCDKYPYLCSIKNNNTTYESYPLLIGINIEKDNMLEKMKK